MLVSRYSKGESAEKQAIYRACLGNTKHINNWDLVDSSAEHIVGAHLKGCSLKTMLMFLIGAVFLLAGCNGGKSTETNGMTGTMPDPDVETVAAGDWYRPPANVTWQWQLKGPVNTGYAIDIYDIDLFDVPETVIYSIQASGGKVICYFSAGSYESWRPDASEFSPGDLGSTLDGWEDEKWLDIRSAGVRRIMQQRLDLAEQKGCDGVEPDNMDGYANDSGFDLKANDQLDFNRFIADEAHKRGLSAGLKNDLDQVEQLVDSFDFSVNEQCHEFDECELLAPFIRGGKPVLNAEYQEDLITNMARRQSLCDAAAMEGLSTLILPLQLDGSFRYSCL